ncbi:hypothetical protein LTR10_017507 [Elasticomyces elasticus]|uniref:Peptidase S54 rhomboid domain-containing protein n=1 Tax=Exophiala sideris TaxID=1016849 RepID=A0ABR0J0Q0_9EURO|nr:hypothetical protein LTR10_017507 [Elasticomyces elasticus]KAK5023488.1 hypothetical protein LTS07_009363 [Exophiala sideris]KAK5028137.1 hypothetical protein LTR13_009125 [Exophiala sideris]KAK5052795.1 hypothetical protein LTR69_009621 [Exophiala sideris]KAK5178406.1 hypothetical protein LTR44_009031 [Eurotiomycetes sp. CCFEE 6388]
MSNSFAETERLVLESTHALNRLNQHLTRSFTSFTRSYSTSLPGMPELRSRFVWSRGIMFGCMGACGIVFGAWSWSRNIFAVPGVSAQNQTPQKRLGMLNWLMTNFTSKTEDVRKNRWWTLLTAAFSHIEPVHLLGNLFTFSTFTSYLISTGITPMHYAGAILSTAIIGNLAWLLQQARKEKVDRQPARALGLSGAVMGLGAAASFAAPRAWVTLFGIVPMPLWAVMGVYIAWDTYMVKSPASGIGHAAHLGGAVAGAVYYGLVLRGRLPLQGF